MLLVDESTQARYYYQAKLFTMSPHLLHGEKQIVNEDHVCKLRGEEKAEAARMSCPCICKPRFFRMFRFIYLRKGIQEERHSPF